MDRRKEDPVIIAINGRIDTLEVLAADIREILQACKSGFKVLGWIGIAAKWITSVGAAIGLLWAFTKFEIGELLSRYRS